MAVNLQQFKPDTETGFDYPEKIEGLIDAAEAAINGKAELSHTHEGGGGDVILSRESGAAADDTLHLLDDGTTERRSGGVKTATLLDDSDPPATRIILGVSSQAEIAALAAGYIKGRRFGLIPRFKAIDELYFGAGLLDINGTICTLTIETGMNINTALGGAFSAYTLYFMAFAVPSSGTVLSSDDLEVTSTPPIWDDAKQGWYTAAGARVFNVLYIGSGGTITAGNTWSGFNGYRHHFDIVVLYNDTTPVYSKTALNVIGHNWGVPIWVGGSGYVKDDVPDSGMWIFHGPNSGNSIACGWSTPEAWVDDRKEFHAVCNASGQIYHYGENLTYSVYQIYQYFLDLPHGV